MPEVRSPAQTLLWLTKQNLEWSFMRWNVFRCLSIDSERRLLLLGKSFTIADAVELLLIHRKQLNALLAAYILYTCFD